MIVRTRFAPSPTGYVHIGGVRTALFCYLFAKKHGGQFILRIDDTDQQRNVEEALQPILDGLQWLGIQWDEGPSVGGPHAPYYQSQRSAKYQAAVNELLQRGFAYRDFAKPEEIQAERDAAVADKKTFTYSRRWMALSEADVRRFEAEGRQSVVRLKMPREGALIIHDLIRSDVEFKWADEQDHVIQRADGSFIYHLANVVDDEDFAISHVIRAEEHLSNTPRQIFMIQSLGYHLPEYAHLPFVAEPGSKTKLSKRKLDKYLKNKDFAKLMDHGKGIADRIGLETTADGFNPVIVDFYKQVGYLPEAIVNAMALVGWALDDKTEMFTMSELIEAFSLEGVTKGAASFDPAKLFAFQEKHMNTKTVEEKVALCSPFLKAVLAKKV
jgi:glutamyl-tRNA synthetase